MKYSLLILIFLLIIGCKDATSPSDPYTATSEVTLSWTGPYAADGCGFIITIGSTKFKPENESIIPDSFKNYGDYKVIMTYTNLQKQLAYSCGDLPKAIYYPVITIVSIKTS